MVNRDSIPRDFECTLVTVYLPKGIQIGKPQSDKIMTLKINEFNLGDSKNFEMLYPHRYMTSKKEKKSKIILQPWTMDPPQSTILNVIKIPHFGRHQEVNACIKLLLSSVHGSYLWLDRRITFNPVLIHRITRLSMQGLEPHDLYPGKFADRTLA
jgi:hypothetical protein